MAAAPEKQNKAKAAAANSCRPRGMPRWEQKDLSWDDVMPVDIIGLEVGYQLIPLVDKNQGGELLNRIKGCARSSPRSSVSWCLRCIRDNLDLAPHQYRITLMGVSTGEATVYHDKEWPSTRARCSARSTASPPRTRRSGWRRSGSPRAGLPGADPGLHRGRCGHRGGHPPEPDPLQPCRLLLGHDEVQQLLDMMGSIQSKLVEGLVPEVISMGNLVKVLQNLLNEGVPIRDMRISCRPSWNMRPAARTRSADRGLPHRPAQTHRAGDRPPEPELPVITPVTRTGTYIASIPAGGWGDGAGIEPGLAERMQRSLVEATQRQELEGQPAVLLTSGILRNTLAKFVKNAIPGLRVLSYQEVPDDKQSASSVR